MNIRRCAIAFVAIALLASSALALDVPTKPAQWVNDYGTNTLNDADVRQLNEKLEGFYKKDGVQFLIMIFPSLEGEDDLEYTNRVANIWKVKDDKALMLFVFMKEHKARIQTGYGMEAVITDAFSSDIVHGTIPPYFRAGDYAGGLNAAVDQVVGKVDPAAVGTKSGPAPSSRVRQSSSGGSRIFGILFFLFIFFVLVPLLSRGRRRGGCGGCIWPMFLGGGGGGTTFGGGSSSGGGWSTGGSWGGGGGSSFGGGGAGGGW